MVNQMNAQVVQQLHLVTDSSGISAGDDMYAVQAT